MNRTGRQAPTNMARALGMLVIRRFRKRGLIRGRDRARHGRWALLRHTYTQEHYIKG
jgi:hypothetical protein